MIEIFCKLLEAESGKQFYLEYKIRHLQAFYSLLEEGLGSDHRHEWMESLLYLHRFIMEKMEERYDGNKYVKLLQTMNSGDQQILEKLLKAVE